MLLDQANDMEKAEIIGKIFIGYVEEEIDLSTFSRLAEIVNKLSLSDLRRMSDRYSDSSRNDRLVAEGLMVIIGLGNEHWESHSRRSFFNYDSTEDGRLLEKYVSGEL